jgi:mannose-6-phosphate isomerase-like protein (cupin superfamily)
MHRVTVFVCACGIAGLIGTVGVAQPKGAGNVEIIPAAKVQGLFAAKGGTITKTDSYKVMASRRDADGQPEVHARDTDIFYILEGSATLVTGGKVVNGKETAPDESSGESIDGGTPQEVTKGDVVTIERGVPHVFKNVKAPLLYYTVKVTAPK